MAKNSLCPNCGISLKDQWLVCKQCHQALWKRIAPYYIWGTAFLAFAIWALTQKVFDTGEWNNVFGYLLPIAGVTFGLISIVMLLMALIATLRGFTVQKMQ
jgi:hypothetical protein